MNGIKDAIARLLRGPGVSRVFARFGVEPVRFWLLIDLFGQLSDRGEMLDHLGRDGVALRTVAWIYFGMSALMSVLLVVAQPTPSSYLETVLLFTGIILLSVLLPETANSLVNPVEGIVLVHQPINGTTYTAAKLMHLARIVVYLVPGLNAIPALAGLILPGATWWYPVIHIMVALAMGAVAALLCCSVFGWLLRFVPARRLKAAAQLVATTPLLAMVWLPQIRSMFAGLKMHRWLPAGASLRVALFGAAGAGAVAIVALGIRSLSADYLIRVASLTRRGSAAGRSARKSRIGAMVARFFGGQPGRAGFSFVSRMMLRDWPFRRQAFPLMIATLAGVGPMVAGSWRLDPFARGFTPLHLLPHLLGAVLFFVCQLLPYGNDYKGAWLFLLPPAQAFGGFARGIYALLWLNFIVVPHALMLPLLVRPWGLWHAGLFMAYSMAIASAYLAVEVRLIGGAPFCKEVDPSRGAVLMPMMMAGGIVMAAAVGLQYLFVFRSPAIVATTTLVAGIAAYVVTRSSLGTFETAIRYELGLLSAGSGTLYKEVGV